jgi:hypothetical protein
MGPPEKKSIRFILSLFIGSFSHLAVLVMHFLSELADKVI